MLMVVVVILGLLVWKLPDGLLHVWVLDVGQGDAILAESPVGEWMMIDGGPDSMAVKKMGEILPFYVDKIDLVVLSHPHADHLNGLIEVIKRYKVKTVLMTGARYNYGAYDEFYKLLKMRGVEVIFTDGESDLKMGKIGFDIIYPQKSIEGSGFNNINNSSIVLRLIYGNKRLMFSGDLEMEKEQEIVEQTQLNLGADLVKAGHHGSRTSNTLDWLTRIHPQWAIISCGVDNGFKHPAPSTVERFLSLGAGVWRTDIDGTVQIVSDGDKLWEIRGLGK